MIDKLAGIPTQIRVLEKKLKDMDASKIKPALIKEITDTIQNLKNLLKEKMEKREERRKAKEQKAAESSTEEVKVEADAITDKVEKDPKVAPHIITPDSLKEHEKLVENVEKSPAVAPHVISEEKPKAELPKYSIDDVVVPSRGEESMGRVLRHDSPNDLCYVLWESGPLKEKHVAGGYYTNDLKKKAEEPKQEMPCPCWDDQTAYCPKCKTQKTSDLKSHYEDMLKDLKGEHQEALDKHDHAWVTRLEFKIKELEDKIKEKFDNEKQAAEFGSHGNGNGLNDLYILPSSPEEAAKIIEFLKIKNHMFQWSNANVKGHSWYGKRFIEIPFGESLKPEIEQLVMSKQAGAQNAEQLTIMDHTPPRANSGPDAGGKDDVDSEFEAEWAEPKIK